MTRRAQVFARAVIAVAVIAGSSALVAPANAATTTAISFAGESTLSVPFGSDWSFAVDVEVTGNVGGGSPKPTYLGPASGTVSVTVSGVGGTFAAGLPIQEDGRAYIAQPITKPLLAAGDYELTAIFVPAGGTVYVSSQTTTPARLTITPLSLEAQASVLSDPAVSDSPYIEARLAGEFVDSFGGGAPGTWEFELLDGTTTVFTATAPQKALASEPVAVPITEKLDAGKEFTLTSTFTPTDDVAGGVSLTQPSPSSFSTPGTGLIDALSTLVPFPTWLSFVLAGVIVVLLALVAILGIRLAKRNRATVGTADPREPGIPGDPENVELGELSEFGIEEISDADSQPTRTAPDAESAHDESAVSEPGTADAATGDSSTDTGSTRRTKSRPGEQD